MPEKLNHTKITEQLIVSIDELIIVETIHSTNDALYQLMKQNPQKTVVYLAEGQTAGKGRQGKSWHSPAYQNIYCSLSFCIEKPMQHIQGLSMQIGSVLLDTLKTLGIDDKLFLKYPNDILYDNKKLIGILIETFSVEKNKTCVIIGIGCNVHITSDTANQITQAWTSLDLITNTINDRNEITAMIINAVYEFLAC